MEPIFYGGGSRTHEDYPQVHSYGNHSLRKSLRLSPVLGGSPFDDYQKDWSKEQWFTEFSEANKVQVGQPRRSPRRSPRQERASVKGTTENAKLAFVGRESERKYRGGISRGRKRRSAKLPSIQCMMTSSGFEPQNIAGIVYV